MKKLFSPLLLLAPCLALLICFVYVPIIVTFSYSLKYYKLTEPLDEAFIGLQNYETLLAEPSFRTVLMNSTVILLLILVFGLILSMGVALVLHRKTKLTPFLTALTVIPWALPPLVNGIIWKFIFFSGYGLLNNLLLKTGLVSQPIAWTNNRYSLLAIVALVVIWRSVPFGAIVILANLQQIPRSYYESLYMDGATPFQAFRHITLPLIVPSLAIVIIHFINTAVNVFDEIIALSGYKFEGQTLAVYSYMTTFNFLDFGLGSAVSYITMIAAGILGYFYVRNMDVEHLY